MVQAVGLTQVELVRHLFEQPLCVLCDVLLAGHAWFGQVDAGLMGSTVGFEPTAADCLDKLYQY